RGSGTYDIADREQVSLRTILTRLRAGMGRPPRLLPFPPSIMRLGLRAAGRGQLAETLLGDLTVDPSNFMQVFGWRPPETTGDAIEASGRQYATTAGRVRRASSEAL
ncbi:hypothetical protein ACFP9U_19505, partial [Nitratireductor sp. GCM10026969]